MEYEGQICRPPMERGSFMLPVMVGCTYNRCEFCGLFRHLQYREIPMEKIEQELQRVKATGKGPDKIFLGDGNAFGLAAEKLLAILELIHRYFPDCYCVNMDATVTSILQKSDDQLKSLFENGVRHLYIGIESGLDDVLSFMKKDHNLRQAYEAVERLQRAGLCFNAHIMTGVAGKGRGQENAEALARFFNRTRPDRVINFSLFIQKEVPLSERIREGSFVPADEMESLKEERTLLSLLDIETAYDGFHDNLPLRVRGKLPRDREKMLEKLNRALD